MDICLGDYFFLPPSLLFFPFVEFFGCGSSSRTSKRIYFLSLSGTVQLGTRYWHYFAVRGENAVGEMKKRSHEVKRC